ncbi:MAG: hypothetical protein C0505_00785 [Leptothrix sp. (in: Bacteria)]|nr:hypothetical protein [Leptothrix sp. (in: b-proteobacteria)]
MTARHLFQRRRAATAVATLATLAAWGLPGITSARDPMQPPLEALPPVSRGPAADGSTPAANQARHILVIDGKRYLIDGGRRRAVGDLLGSARIERIDDDAVVVREAGSLQRLPLYAGVVKRPSIDGLSLAAAPLAATAARPPRVSLRGPLPSVRSGETR